MDDITLYAPYLLLLFWPWHIAAQLLAWARTPRSERMKLEGASRWQEALFNCVQISFYGSITSISPRSYLNFFNLGLFYVLLGLVLIELAGYVFNVPQQRGYRHAIDILLFRRPLRPGQAAGPISRRPPPHALAAGSLVAAMLLVSVLGVSTQPCAWLDRFIQRSGCIRELSAKTAGIHDVRVSPDGRLVAYSIDGQVQIRQLSNGSVLHTLEHPGGGKSLAFSADGVLLASGGSDKTVRIWRVNDGTLVRTIAALNWVESVAFSPDSSLLATAGDGVQVWRVADGTLVWQSPANAYQVAFSPDGQRLVVGGAESIEVWQLANQQVLQTIKHREARGSLSLALSADGTLLAANGYREKITVWQLATGTPIQTIIWPMTLTERDLNVNVVAFSPDGSLVAAGASDNTARIWRVADGTLVKTLPQTNEVSGMAFAPDGRLVVGSNYGSLRHWKVQP